MAGNILVKQPNGLYCIFSNTSDMPEMFNITREEYIDLCIERARKNAEHTLDHAYPFTEIINSFTTNNMTEEEFNIFLISVGSDYVYKEPED